MLHVAILSLTGCNRICEIFATSAFVQNVYTERACFATSTVQMCGAQRACFATSNVHMCAQRVLCPKNCGGKSDTSVCNNVLSEMDNT